MLEAELVRAEERTRAATHACEQARHEAAEAASERDTEVRHAWAILARLEGLMPGSKAADSTPQTVRRTEMSGCGDRGAASEASTSATGTRQTGSVWSALETQLQQVESSLRAREAATASAVEARRLAERVRDDAKRECAEAHEAREAEARRTAAARSSLQADAVSLPACIPFSLALSTSAILSQVRRKRLQAALAEEQETSASLRVELLGEREQRCAATRAPVLTSPPAALQQLVVTRRSPPQTEPPVRTRRSQRRRRGASCRAAQLRAR